MFLPKRHNRGEVALTFTLLSLALMIIGTVVGLGVNKTQDIRSSAAGGAVCGKQCTNNSSCGTDSTSGTKTSCDFSQNPHICIATRGIPNNPPCIAGLKDCNEACKKNEDCNGGLRCDTRVHTCQKIIGQCPPVATPTGFHTLPIPTEGPGGGGGTGGGTGGATATPSGPVYQGSKDPKNPVLGNAFRLTGSSPCYIEWHYEKDPNIEELYLKAGTNTLDLTTASPLPGSDSAPVKGAGVNFKSGGIAIGFDPNEDYVRSHPGPEVWLKIGQGGGQEKVWYFARPTPDWLGRETTLVYVKYKGKISGEERWWFQTANAAACRTDVVPSNTPTPTLGMSSCFRACTSDSQCPIISINNRPTKLLCIALAGTSLCRNSDYPTSPNCLPPKTTLTNTPTPTKTPTPTRTPPPTATPTPPVCNKSVYFMIDNSSTQTGNPALISGKLNEYFRGNNYDRVSFSYDTFNRTVEDGEHDQINGLTFKNIQDKQWTNINAAFNTISSNQADEKIFISDGIPTLLDSGISGVQCTYRHNPGANSTQWTGCIDPNGGPDLNTGQCKSRYDKIEETCTHEYPIGSANATQSVTVAGNEGAISANMVRAGGKQYPTFDSLVNGLPSILNALCSRTTQGIPSHPTRFQSSYSINNQSSSKTIDKVIVKACKTGGKSCQEYAKSAGIAPRQTFKFSQTLPETLPAANRAVLSCDVGYADGSRLPCPAKNLESNNGLQFDLTVTDKKVTGNVQSFSKACDQNKDGVVNGLDYVRCVNQIGSTGGKKSCDVILDDLVNAQDISVCLDTIGKPVK